MFLFFFLFFPTILGNYPVKKYPLPKHLATDMDNFPLSSLILHYLGIPVSDAIQFYTIPENFCKQIPEHDLLMTPKTKSSCMQTK